MFYSNEHYMSISHIPLIANMVHIHVSTDEQNFVLGNVSGNGK